MRRATTNEDEIKYLSGDRMASFSAGHMIHRSPEWSGPLCWGQRRHAVTKAISSLVTKCARWQKPRNPTGVTAGQCLESGARCRSARLESGVRRHPQHD